MTGSRGYHFLEDKGIWRSPTELTARSAIIRRETDCLVIAKPDGTILTHWWLHAIGEIPAPEGKARFSPDPTGLEYVEITDKSLIEALRSKDRDDTAKKSTPKRQWHRIHLRIAALLLLLAATIYVFSDEIVRTVPEFLVHSQRVAIGQRMLDALLEHSGGESCSSITGDNSLAIFKSRVVNQLRGDIRVVRGIGPASLMLPGEMLVLNASLFREHDDPQVIAGFALLAMEVERTNDSLTRFTSSLGPIEAARLVFNRPLQTPVYENFARQLSEGTGIEVSPLDLAQRFRDTGVLARPFAEAAGNAGLDAEALSRAATLEGEYRAISILDDADWLHLKNICR